jgi:hypothetical protein
MEKLVEAPKTIRIAENISYDSFLKKYTNVHAEWTGGEVILFVTASDRHQDIVRWLIALLTLFVETYDLGWLRPVPFNMYMPDLAGCRRRQFSQTSEVFWKDFTGKSAS